MLAFGGACSVLVRVDLGLASQLLSNKTGTVSHVVPFVRILCCCSFH